MPTAALSPNTLCSLHDWMNLRSELLFIVDSPIPAGAGDYSGERRDREFSAWLVVRGWARIESEGEKAVARAGEWLICSGRRITQTFSPNVHLLAMRVRQSWPDGSPLLAGGSITVLKAARHPALERNARRLQGLVSKLSWAGAGNDDPREVFQWRNRMDYRAFMAYQRHLQAWLLALADGLEEAGRRLKVPDGGDPRLAKVCQLLDTMPEGAAYPRAKLAEEGGLTLGRLNQLFYKTYGLTTHQYWERRRLERARIALDNPMIPVKQVAFDLGFGRLSHFSRWFKRSGGISPRGYRRAGVSAVR